MKSDSLFSMKFKNMIKNQSSVLYQARYCTQEDISIVACKDGIIKMLEHPLSMRNFTSGKAVCTSLKTNRYSRLVVNGSGLYLIGESKQKSSFVKFYEFSKSLNVLPLVLDERLRFCVCSFMQKIIVIGGYKNKESISSCMAYDIKTNKWTYIASMN